MHGGGNLPSLALLAKSAETLSNKVEEINSVALKQRLPDSFR